MASDRPTLKVQPREIFGTRPTRRLRAEGIVPGVVYGQGGDARPFQVAAAEITHLLKEGHTLFDLDLEGASAVPVVIKEDQRHPVRGEIMHLDCLEVRLDVKIQSDVAVELEGAENAPGVREGGVLEHVTREVTIEALPGDIPEQLVLDVSEMEINDTYTLERITPPSGVEYMADDISEITIVTLSPPRVEEEPEPELEEETELVGEGEGEEGERSEGEGAEDSGSGGDGDSSSDEG